MGIAGDGKISKMAIKAAPFQIGKVLKAFLYVDGQ